MPLYEYQCKNCNESFEKIVSFAEANKTPPCPICGEEETHKKISLAASFSTSTSGSVSSGACAPGGRYT